ncbi:hypothetical protein [Micromonospora cathayae]|uniref:Uncharacterized protein n=1 Tax=Micromonospora cathayae TaxID=3028804 RepID=A0ABY7ZS31_9ACTN|nr:hypothetical protein [Micromonospora sp. HUAS 3]WDZ85765.1 hypothetical protein PVK37_04795 [Micromonospora sp. HUAS 3]
MNTSLNGENLPINRRFPSAGRWALCDMDRRDRGDSGEFSQLDDNGDPVVGNPAPPYRGSGGNYAYR